MPYLPFHSISPVMGQQVRNNPPPWAMRFLSWFCDPELLEDVQGDLLELYQEKLETGVRFPRWWFISQILLLFRPGIIRSIIPVSKTQTTMIGHYLTTAWRHALRYKAHTMLNLFGLIIGITSAILLLLWVQAELSVDKFHDKSDRLVMVWRNMHLGSGVINTVPSTPQPMATLLTEEYPEVDEVAIMSWEMEFPLRYEEHDSYYAGYYVSPEFFSIFSYPMLFGDVSSVFDDPSSVVITESTAAAIFGPENVSAAIGQTLTLNVRQEYKVTGVIGDTGTDSSFQFDILIPAAAYIAENDWVESWYNGGFRIYMTLHDPSDLAELQTKVEDQINVHTDNAADERIYLQPFTDTYLYGTFENGLPVSGRMQYVRILGVTAIFLLLIAGINYTNLTTARSSRRAREVGLRKMFGARTGSIGVQFYLESFLIILISVLIAMGLVVLLLPYFSQLAGKTLFIHWGDPLTWGALGSLVVILTLIAGFYPALVMPTFKIISSLKNVIMPGAGKSGFRRALVVFQFALSMLLISGMLVVSNQLDFILTKNLGVEKENRIAISLENYSPEQKEVFRNMAMSDPEISSVTLTSSNPLSTGWSTGGAEWDGKDPDFVAEINVMAVDEHFIHTLGVELVQGEGFSGNALVDSASFIINEVAADLMGYDNAVGRNLSMWGTDGKIVGVVRDFHMSNLYSPIEPLIIRYDLENTFMAIAHVPDSGEGLAQLRELNRKVAPDIPFNYRFLDQDFASDYQNEQSVGKLMKIFAGLSILIACLGLFGLISYTNEQRRQEIGIRKVMGASASGLVFLLSREYLILLAIAIILASPLAWFLAEGWLDNFAFHVGLGLNVFVVASLLLLLVGALTTGIKSMVTAQMNPVESIRNE